MSHQTHPYHLVNPSPWPIVGAFSLLGLTLGGAMAMHGHTGGLPLAIFSFMMILYTMYVWWRDIVKESREDKAHTAAVSHGLRVGMVLFIVSEVMFFAAFFWAFFNASLFPKLPLAETWEIAAGVWPPKGIVPFDAWHLPFLNTLILLLSGTTVTWAHHAMLEGNNRDTIRGLTYTVFLGALFTACQAYEYSHAALGFKDGIYASTFYLATGFHGLHVLIGTIFLTVCLVRAKRGHFTPEKHLGFEFAAWYWHFVDVVWIFLFCFVYVWGGAH
jgi:cytochrome c oxidase subunit III